MYFIVSSFFWAFLYYFNTCCVPYFETRVCVTKDEQLLYERFKTQHQKNFYMYSSRISDFVGMSGNTSVTLHYLTWGHRATHMWHIHVRHMSICTHCELMTVAMEYFFLRLPMQSVITSSVPNVTAAQRHASCYQAWKVLMNNYMLKLICPGGK